MHYRIETYVEGPLGAWWKPWTIEPFESKDAAESHRLEILHECGGHPDFLRVREYETPEDRRNRLLAAWREMFPAQRCRLDRERESILLSMVSDDDLEKAVGLVSAAAEPTAREYEAVNV